MTKLALNWYLLGDIWQLSELRKCMGLPIGITVGLMLYKSQTTWYEKVIGVLNERIIIRRKTCFCCGVLIIVLPRHPLTAVWDKNRGWGGESWAAQNYQGFQGLSGTDSIITKTEGRDQSGEKIGYYPGRVTIQHIRQSPESQQGKETQIRMSIFIPVLVSSFSQLTPDIRASREDDSRI